MNNSAFFKIGYGLYVLCAHENGKDNGCIVNAVMQVTDTPKRILVAVNKQNKTCEMIKSTKKLTVSVLSEKADFEIFKHFGFQSGNDVDKFDGFKDAKRAENGVLYVTKTTNAYISATVTTETDLGTHILFTCEANDAEVLTDDKTATYTYYQENIKPQPQKSEAKGYRCKICGYVYEGEPLPSDFICPLCKHPASDFERI